MDRTAKQDEMHTAQRPLVSVWSLFELVKLASRLHIRSSGMLHSETLVVSHRRFGTTNQSHLSPYVEGLPTPKTAGRILPFSTIVDVLGKSQTRPSTPESMWVFSGAS